MFSTVHFVRVNNENVKIQNADEKHEKIILSKTEVKLYFQWVSWTKPQLYFIAKYYIIEFNKNIATTANTNDLV